MVLGLHPFSVVAVSDLQILVWLEEAGGTFPVMHDFDGTYSDYDHLGATAPFPLDIVVDQQGVVAYVNTRFEPDELQSVIDGLLDR